MPRVVSLPKTGWRDAAFSADFSDSNFEFLGQFEEFLPTQNDDSTKKGKKRKTKTASAEEIVSDSGISSNLAESSGDSGDIKQSDIGGDDVENKPKQLLSKKQPKSSQTNGQTSRDANSDGPALAKKSKSQIRKEKKLRKLSISKNLEGVPPKKKVKISKKLVPLSTTEDSEETKLSVHDQHKESAEEVAFDTSNWLEFNLPEELLKAIGSLKFHSPSEIQRLVLPPAINHRVDILGAAETGSGKTLAFALPALTRILTDERVGNGPRALVIAPTRELAVQIFKTFVSLCKFTNIRAATVVGGLAEQKQLRVMEKKRPEVLIATPGRLWDLMKEAASDSYLHDLSGLQCLIVDETDRIVEQGHFAEMKNILDKVKRSSTFAQAGKMQTLVFSATLTFVVPQKSGNRGNNRNRELTTKEKTNLLVESTGIRKQHRVIDITREYGTAEKLVETRMNCDGLLDKDTNLVYLLTRYKGRTLVFTNSKDASKRLYGILNALNFKPQMLHANMVQRQRLRNLERFTATENSILLATDVAARGLDIKGIEHVIHYQVPKTAETYIHRSGRTARASETGLTVLMVDPKDAFLYKKMCRNLNRENDLPVFPVDSEELLQALKRRVKLASEFDTLNHRAKKIRLSETWFERAAREADLDLEDRSRDQEIANDQMNAIMSKLDIVKIELKGALREELPDANKVKHMRTKFITPELSSMYEKTSTDDAIEDLKQHQEESESVKKQHKLNERTKQKLRKKSHK